MSLVLILKKRGASKNAQTKLSWIDLLMYLIQCPSVEAGDTDREGPPRQTKQNRQEHLHIQEEIC